MNKEAEVTERLGDMPHFVECGLCLLPRTGGMPICPFCHSDEPWKELQNIPEDFALRLAADGRWEAVAAFLESEVAAGRETAAGCLLMAWIALVSNDLRAVEVWSHESLRLQPGQAGPHLLLGLVFERARRWEEALAEYSLALSFPMGDDRRSALQQRKSHCNSQIPQW